jgi:hypothetical protein
VTKWEFRVWQETGDLVGHFEVHSTNGSVVIEDYSEGHHVKTIEGDWDAEQARQEARVMTEVLLKKAIEDAIGHGLTAHDGVMHDYGLFIQEVSVPEEHLAGREPSAELATADFPAPLGSAQVGSADSAPRRKPPPAPSPGAGPRQ